MGDMTVDLNTAGIGGFAIAVLTWFSMYLKDRHNRSINDRKHASDAHHNIISEYANFNERVQRREEKLLARINDLETKMRELQIELLDLNKLLAKCLQKDLVVQE